MFKKRKEQPPKFNLHRTLASGVSPKASSLDINSALNHGLKRRQVSWKKVCLLILLVFMVPLLVIGIWDYRNFSAASSKIFGDSNPAAVFAGKPLENSDGRVNVLLVGYSADDPEHGGALLTDSIMVLSLNKDGKTGYMLSVPRDLYVDIPGYKKAKINEAYQTGERANFNESGYGPGGIGLLQKIISDNFELELHYYFLIDYAAVRDTVDALSGVEVLIDSPDKRGVYDPNFQPHEGGPLKLSNGPQSIDGQTALRLSRARGSTFGSYGFPQSDFNRTQNQQAVLSAIKKELSWPLVLDPRTNGQIFNAAAENLQTDLQISELLPFYRLMTSVPADKLKSTGLNDINNVNLLVSYRTPSGQSALVPADGISDFTKIQEAIRKLNQ